MEEDGHGRGGWGGRGMWMGEETEYAGMEEHGCMGWEGWDGGARVGVEGR